MPELGEPISERELDVLNCLAEGASNREIADQLSISHNTVKVHVRNIFTKLGVSSRTEAATVALQKGVLSIPGLEPEPVVEDGEGVDDEDEAQDTENGSAEAADDDENGDVATETAEPLTSGDRELLKRRNLLGIIGLVAIGALLVVTISLLLDNMGTALSPTGSPADAAPTVEAFQEIDLGDNWVQSRTLPEPRSRMAMATVGLNVYAIGGESTEGVDNRVLIFDSQQQRWRRGAAKLTAAAGAAAGVLAGEIYVAGGYGDNGQATTAVEAYSPLNDAWRPVTALPRPVAGAVAIVSDGLLYLFGGEDGETVLADAFVYDPARQQWETLPPMEQARTMAVGGVLSSKLYVVGGSDGNAPLSSCEAFEPATSEWSQCPSMQQGRAAAGSAVFLNKLYVLGGEIEGQDAAGEVYDVAEETWTPFNIPMLADAPDWPHVGVSGVETHIYALGGEQDGALSDGMYVYRPLVHQFFIPAAPAGGGD